jgi:hypothetical protein
VSSTPSGERSDSELAPYSQAADRETVVAGFGRVTRAGSWVPPEELRAVAGFATVKLDFTRAEVPAGVTQVKATALFGNVVIVVPRSLEVELDGVSVFGNLVQHSARGERATGNLRRWLGMHPPREAGAHDLEPPADEEAFLSIKGTAIFGNVILEIR